MIGIFYLDVEFKGNIIGVHPNDNTATVWMKSEDLIQLIREHGNEVKLLNYKFIMHTIIRF